MIISVCLRNPTPIATMCTTNSIEDARTALLCFRKYLELSRRCLNRCSYGVNWPQPRHNQLTCCLFTEEPWTKRWGACTKRVTRASGNRSHTQIYDFMTSVNYTPVVSTVSHALKGQRHHRHMNHLCSDETFRNYCSTRMKLKSIDAIQTHLKRHKGTVVYVQLIKLIK